MPINILFTFSFVNLRAIVSLHLYKLYVCRYYAGLSQSEEISSDLCCFYGGGISHNEDAFFSKVYCCLILNYPTAIEMWIWILVVRALVLCFLKFSSSKILKQ